MKPPAIKYSGWKPGRPAWPGMKICIAKAKFGEKIYAATMGVDEMAIKGVDLTMAKLILREKNGQRRGTSWITSTGIWVLRCTRE